MLDNTLIALIISTILAGEAVAGISGTPIAQAFQPTQQGVNTDPTAYLYKVGDERLGFPFRADIWDSVQKNIVHTELQQYATTFQISALSVQNPASTTQYTASDILNLIAYILQSSATIATFTANDVGIIKIGSVRNTPFIDDHDRHEYAPSMDFVIQHKQIITSMAPIVEAIELTVERV